MESSGRKMTLPWRSVGIGLSLLVIVAVSLVPAGAYVPPVLAALLLLPWTFARPVRAMSVVILGNLMFLSTTEGISLPEIFFGTYLFGYLAFWAWKRVFLERAPIIEHVSDYYLLAFFVICVATLPITVFNGQTVLWWFRELLTFSHLLMYFPLRDSMRERKGMITLLVVLLGTFGLVAIYNLVTYRAASAAVSYFWELTASRQAVGDNFFFPGVVVLISLWIHLQDRKAAWMLLPPLALIALALALTFTRGFWLAAFLAIVVLFVFAGGRERLRLGLSALGGGLVGVFLVNVFLGRMGQSVLESLVSRMLSTRDATTDISFMNRLFESKEAWKRILEQPILGHGVGAMFSRFDIIKHETVETLYIHNGYLFLLFKVGLVGFIPYVFFLLIVVWTGIRLSFAKSVDDVQHAILRAFAAILCAMLIVTTTSNVFIQKQALLVLAFSTACVMATHLRGERTPAAPMERP